MTHDELMRCEIQGCFADGKVVKNPAIRDPIDTKIHGNCGIITRFQTERGEERSMMTTTKMQEALIAHCQTAPPKAREKRGGRRKDLKTD